MTSPFESIAVCFLARGLDPDWENSIERFVKSYIRFGAGVSHKLYVILKGFETGKSIKVAETILSPLTYQAINLEDKGFDLGAYYIAAGLIDEEAVCFLNTHSEILGGSWLRKLCGPFDRPNTGMTGATGSFESLKDFDKAFAAFPNPHLRSNGLLIRRQVFLEIMGGRSFDTKLDLFLIESGPKSLSAALMDRRQKIFVVGRNGRAYTPRWWPFSDTFRLGRQPNLLIGDNQTRNFEAMRWAEKHAFCTRTWGAYIQEEVIFRERC